MTYRLATSSERGAAERRPDARGSPMMCGTPDRYQAAASLSTRITDAGPMRTAQRAAHPCQADSRSTPSVWPRRSRICVGSNCCVERFVHDHGASLTRSFVEDIYVEPAYRGRGIGLALFRHMARVALRRDCVAWNGTCSTGTRRRSSSTAASAPDRLTRLDPQQLERRDAVIATRRRSSEWLTRPST